MPSTVLAAVLLLLAVVLAAPPALAASTTDGHLGPSYGSSVTHPPTSDKPQSKLWWNDGSWWATMWVSGKGWHIERLDRTSESWVDTGVLVDSRATTLTDTLWDGHHLFVAAAVSTVSTDEAPHPSTSGAARLYRYRYANGTYTLDSGYPTTINTLSSEDLTIDEDSTGALWATWVTVAGSTSAGWTATVYVADSSAGGARWATPFVVPVGDAHPAPDDISAVVAFAGDRIGVMWSDQRNGTLYWAMHTDGTSPTARSSWKVLEAVSGTDQTDDHMNLKTLQADSAGRVVAAVKTSLDLGRDPGAKTQTRLLVFTPSSGRFASARISTVADCQTRPQVVLDATDDVVHVFSTGPPTSVSGCPHAGTAGAVYEKTSPLDHLSFASGRGTPVLQDGPAAKINNVTTSKQSVTAATGLVVLASDSARHRYWFVDRHPSASALGSPPVPVPVPAPAPSPSGGAVQAEWLAQGGASGYLGAALTAETATPGATGSYQRFQGGSVYWAPSSGAHAVHGAVRAEWASLGWERSVLGFPTTDESATPDGVGRYNHFQGGSVYWTPATGAHEVHGAIRTTWASLGWERSALGYPTSDEHAVPGGRRSDFQGGSITWTSSGGTVVTYT